MLLILAAAVLLPAAGLVGLAAVLGSAMHGIQNMTLPPEVMASAFPSASPQTPESGVTWTYGLDEWNVLICSYDAPIYDNLRALRSDLADHAGVDRVVGLTGTIEEGTRGAGEAVEALGDEAAMAADVAAAYAGVRAAWRQAEVDITTAASAARAATVDGSWASAQRRVDLALVSVLELDRVHRSGMAAAGHPVGVGSPTDGCEGPLDPGA